MELGRSEGYSEVGSVFEEGEGAEVLVYQDAYDRTGDERVGAFYFLELALVMFLFFVRVGIVHLVVLSPFLVAENVP